MSAPLVSAGRALCALGLLSAWHVASFGAAVPSPAAVGARLIALTASGELFGHTATTLIEAGSGFALGAASAIALALALRTVPRVADALAPLLSGAMSIPKIAVAPLVFLWFGVGLTGKVALVSVAAFFPVFFGTLSGLNAADRSLLSLARVMGARGPFLAWRVILPSALPFVLSSFTATLPQTVTVAVVGELIAADSGLGYYIHASGAQADLVGMLAGVVAVSGLVIALNSALARLRTKFVRRAA
jgi:NitT/TauT family transport system permease protein